MSLIKAENLGIKKGSHYIVSGVDWTIDAGERWVLFGLNGCGKTTLLSILSGYLSGSEGKSFLFDDEVTKENFIDLRKRVGFVSNSFFDAYLHSEIALEIILAGKFGTLGLWGEIDDADIRKAKELGGRFGLGKKLRYPYDLLSKGQRQEVLIARALMNDPEILILDEPCSGLDIVAKEQFLGDMEELAERKDLAIVYVTHQTEEITPFFNKAALMKDGEIVVKDDLEKVFTREVLGDFFGFDANVIWTDRHFFIELEKQHNAAGDNGKEKAQWTHKR